jgi:hypothetical protein
MILLKLCITFFILFYCFFTKRNHLMMEKEMNKFETTEKVRSERKRSQRPTTYRFLASFFLYTDENLPYFKKTLLFQQPHKFLFPFFIFSKISH